jgi:hypothetical protein
MRAKETDAISGMHMPAGESMWASPADDEEEEDEDMKKEALGLTSVPGEQQRDYQLEQPFHIKDPDNVGVIDVETPVDLPPMNNAKDSSPEKKMEELLEDLIQQLESRGYAEKAQMLKTSQLQQDPKAVWAAAAEAEKQAWAPIIAEVKDEASDHNVPHFTTDVEAVRSEWLAAVNGPNPATDEKTMVRPYVSKLRSVITQAMKDMGRADSRHGFQDGEMKSWESEGGQKSHLWDNNIRLYEQKAVALVQAARQLQMSGMPSIDKPEAKPQQAAKSRGASGWDSYAASGADQKALADAWQAKPPEGYDPEFSSFQQWYLKKHQELGRHFGPKEALEMIGGAAAPEEAKPEEKTVGLTDGEGEVDKDGKPAEEAAKPEETSETVRARVEAFLTDILSDARRVRGLLGTRNRATKQRIRNLGGVDGAAEAIIEAAGGWENLARLGTEVRQDDRGRSAFSEFDTAVWKFLKEARRAQRRGRAEDGELERAEARAERMEFLNKISS